MNDLLPCPGCQRHVRRNEASCPFCAVALDLSQVELALPRARLGRAALFAFGATLAASISTIACGSDDDGGGSGGTSSGGTSSGGTSSGGNAGSGTGGTGTGGSAGSATGGASGAGTGGEAGNATGGFAGFSADYGTPPFDGG